MITETVARIITLVLPTKNWYKAAFLFTKYYAKVSGAPAQSWISQRYPASFRLNHALKLETLLATIQAISTLPFPIPVCIIGEELVDITRSGPNGFLVCSVHTPLNVVGVRCLLDKGLKIDAIIARYPPASGYFTIPGTLTHIPAILVDRTTLVKAKSVLQQGGCVITLVDSLADGQFSPNQFQLAIRLKSKLTLVMAGLEADGTISVHVLDAVDFIFTTDSSSAEAKFLNEIGELNKKALQMLSE